MINLNKLKAPNRKQLETVGYALGIVIVIVLFIKFLRRTPKEKVEVVPPDNQAKQFAYSVKQALNPSGNEYMQGFDGTDEKALYNLAKNANFKARLQQVNNYYNSLFSSDMLKDIQAELDSEEYNRFLNLLNS